MGNKKFRDIEESWRTQASFSGEFLQQGIERKTEAIYEEIRCEKLKVPDNKTQFKYIAQRNYRAIRLQRTSYETRNNRHIAVKQ